MIICPKCNSLMRHVRRFTPTQNCELDICTKCYFETKPKKMRFDEKITQNKIKDKPKPKKDRVKKNAKKSRSKHNKRK